MAVYWVIHMQNCTINFQAVSVAVAPRSVSPRTVQYFCHLCLHCSESSKVCLVPTPGAVHSSGTNTPLFFKAGAGSWHLLRLPNQRRLFIPESRLDVRLHPASSFRCCALPRRAGLGAAEPRPSPAPRLAPPRPPPPPLPAPLALPAPRAPAPSAAFPEQLVAAGGRACGRACPCQAEWAAPGPRRQRPKVGLPRRRRRRLGRQLLLRSRGCGGGWGAVTAGPPRTPHDSRPPAQLLSLHSALLRRTPALSSRGTERPFVRALTARSWASPSPAHPARGSPAPDPGGRQHPPAASEPWPDPPLPPPGPL